MEVVTTSHHSSGDNIMQYDNPQTLHKIKRYDGLKVGAFVIFCLVMSLLMLGGTVALWLFG
jgi:hypothetical protein